MIRVDTLFIIHSDRDLEKARELSVQRPVYILNLSEFSNTAFENLPNCIFINENEMYENTKALFFKSHLNNLRLLRESSLEYQKNYFNTSLWWVSEFQHKDNFYDENLYYVIIENFIEQICTKFKIKTVLNRPTAFVSDSLFFYSCRLFISRSKLLLKTMRLKLFAKEGLPTKGKNAFYSFYPGNWKFINHECYEKFSSNFEHLQDRTYIVSAQNYCKKIPFPLIEKQVSLSEIILSYFNLSYFFIFIYSLRKYFIFFNTNRTYLKVMIRLGLRSTLVNDFCYAVQIAGLTRFAKNNKISNIVSTGEFGLESNCAVIAARIAGVKSVWFQHALPVIDKLYYHSDDKETFEGKPTPDLFYVWSNYSFQFFQEISRIDHEKMIIVESIKKLKKINVPLKGRDKYIFCPSADKKEIKVFISLISQLIKNKIIVADNVILKLHPTTKNFLNVTSINLPCEISDSVVDLSFFALNAKCIIAGGTMLGPELSLLSIPIIQYIPEYYFNWSALDSTKATTFSNLTDLTYWINHLEEVKKIDSQAYFSELS